MNLSDTVRTQLEPSNLTIARFREIVARLFSYGIIVREEDRTEQAFYDDARRVQALLEDYFELSGFLLYHDATNQFYRLYAPGAVVDGLPEDPLEPVPSLRARVSADFVAAALALRMLYQNKLNAGDIQAQGEALISFEELAVAIQTQLKRALPGGATEKMQLLAELRRHRLLSYSSGFTIADEDAFLAIRPTILGVVSNDAMTMALDSDGVIEQVATTSADGDTDE